MFLTVSRAVYPDEVLTVEDDGSAHVPVRVAMKEPSWSTNGVVVHAIADRTALAGLIFATWECARGIRAA